MERNVKKQWGSFILKGVALAAAYGLAYLALRYISFNQWFLPAGLRAACLLFLPYRYWPFIILGDASAVFYQRLPKLDQYAAAWVYAGPLLLIGFFAIALRLVRARLKRPDDMYLRIPLIALFISIWAALCTSLFNYMLGGPRQPDGVRNFTEYVTGNFLGILMFVLPIMIWKMRSWETSKPKLVFRDAILASAFLFPLFIFVKLQSESEGLIRQTALMLMILPAAFLTLRHGWHGAAVGVLLVNLTIAQTMEYAGVPRYYDDTVFLSHIGLTIGAVVFLLFGRRITLNFEKARKSGIAEQEALKFSRISLFSNEPAVRDQLIIMASMQVEMDDARDVLAKDLRANGKYREAMDLHRRGMEHRQLFEVQALVVYPIGIERDGLFGVLDTAAFRESRACEVEVDFAFGRTDPRTLSEDLQVSAYRCVCHAIDHLSDWEPSDYRLSLRVWHGRTRRGLYLSAAIATLHERHATPHGESAGLLLEARVKAHGGLLRRSPQRIRLLLWEPVEAPPALQTPSPGQQARTP